MMSLSVLVIFVVTMMLGLPIAVSMGLSAGVVIWIADMPLSVLAQRTINALDSVPLLAVPMFIFAAALFGASGITRHLFAVIQMVVGRIRGGMGHVTVLANLIFSGISGAALADIGALGGTQIREMRERGYSDEFAAGRLPLAIDAMDSAGITEASSRPMTVPPLTNSTQRSASGD